jgi:serine/threonine protein phosphatase PrpC
MTAPTMAGPQRKPYDDEIDVYGITHQGKVRKDNQDHFLICSLKRQIVVRQTSLPNIDGITRESDRLAFLMMVADGVGGGVKGEEASRTAVEAATQYVQRSMRCYYATRAQDDEEFFDALKEAALGCHGELMRRGQKDPEYRGMATTLTLYLGVWPCAYLLQVGDSRCYILEQGQLSQITRDQTMAQELVDLGVMKPADAKRSKLGHTLSSAIGGRNTEPVVTRRNVNWGNVALLCSDGLTQHVSDERIRERLLTMKSSRQVCEDLLNDALADGGSDNITLIVARALPSTS